MRATIIICLIFLSTILFSFSQNLNKEILFTVGNEDVTAAEFIRVYNKNLNLVQDQSQKNIDNYLKLFINYKLKLAEARALDYHKKPQYINEFNSYKSQLAKNYLTDHAVSDALVKEAYDRISHDVKASHILIKIDPNVKDTVAVYNQILGCRDILVNEPDFSKVRSQLHNGTTVFAEDLGYFSGFKMIYDFENFAFNTSIGEVSQPFRTQFGYHVVKVFDKRKSRGEVTVGHIMINHKQKDSAVIPEQRIAEIYAMIEQGQEFEDLAKQFSNDQSSASNGGKLKPFKSGQLTSVIFEDEAFKLKSIGEISQPFRSDYGWHIVKLFEKKPVGTYNELKNGLESRVRRDPRSAIINESFITRLRKDYNISDENPELQYFFSVLNQDYFGNEWKRPSDMPEDKILLKIGDTAFTYGEFVQHLESSQKSTQTTSDFNEIVNNQYRSFVDEKLLAYHETNLENVNEEYANILEEYRDGLLLFDLMETKIWSAVGQDSVGLKAYYEANKAKFTIAERVDVVMASTNSKKQAQKVRAKLKQGIAANDVIKELNTNGKSNVILTTETMFVDDPRLPEAFKLKKGISDILEHNQSFHVIFVNEVIPGAQKTFDEARGAVISEYQLVVEDRWLKELEDKYKVVLNEDVLQKIKNQTNN